MYIFYRSKEKEICEVGMVEMFIICVYLWVMVVYFDNIFENIIKCKKLLLELKLKCVF